jgi:hypothetical protein
MSSITTSIPRRCSDCSGREHDREQRERQTATVPCDRDDGDESTGKSDRSTPTLGSQPDCERKSSEEAEESASERAQRLGGGEGQQGR